MPPDVFISHAHKDRLIAHAVCEKLESAQIKCWIAERDISTGDDWTEATRTAIGSSQAMVLLLSENANAAAHLEREMAHAFYTRRLIIPLRLTDTLPRRDFLFYLGSARSFDAFGPSAEQQLEALTTAIEGVVRGRTDSRATRLLQPADGAAAVPNFSESWIGALQASHYRTLQILKHAAIAASLVGAGWLFWSVHRQNENEMGDGHSGTLQSSARDSTGLSPRPSADISPSKPGYAFTRFGLWVPPPNAVATPALQQGTQDPLAVAHGAPTTGATSPQRGIDPEADGEEESLQTRNGTSKSSMQESRPRTGIRREGNRERSRAKVRQRKVAESLARRIARLKNRLNTGWRQFLARGKDTSDR